MADLGTIELGTWTDVSNTAIQGSDPVLENIAGTNDADYVHDDDNSTHTGVARFALGATPSDFGNILTVAIQLRYGLEGGAADNNTWDSLKAQIFKSDGTTALTDNVEIVAGTITNESPTNSSVITLTNPDQAATKTEWDAAVVHISFDISRTKGGDSINESVYAAEVTGTYALATGNHDQDRYRFGDDETSEAAHGWLAALDTFAVIEPDTTFLIRISVQNSVLGGSITLKLQNRKNEGTWTDVTTTSSDIKTVTGTVVTDGGDTTDRLGASGTFITDNNYQDDTGAVAALTFATGEQTEYLGSLQIVAADTKYGDKIELRLVESDNTPLDTYTSTPQLWRDSAAVVLRRVEQFSVSLSTSQASNTHTMGTSMLDVDKCFLLFSFRGSISGSPHSIQMGGVITDVDTLTFSRFAHASNAIEIEGYLVEFTDGVRCERGTITAAQLDGGTGGEFEVALSNIWDDTKAFHFRSVEADQTVGGYSQDSAYTTELISSGGVVSVRAQTNDTTDARHDIKWQAIQYKDCAVQRGDMAHSTSVASSVDTLSPVVDPDKSWCNCSWRHGSTGDADPGKWMLRAKHSVSAESGDEITVERDHHGTFAITDIRWEVVEFTDSVVVEEVLEDHPAADASEDIAITEVSAVGTDGNAAVFASGWDMSGGITDQTTGLDSGEAMLTSDLTTTTNLQSIRTVTAGATSTIFYVIDFEPSSGADGVGIQTLKALTQAGVAAESFPGVGVQTLIPLLQNAVGVMHPDGVGIQTLTPVTQAAVAEEQFPGVGSQTLTPLTQAAVAEEQLPGVGSQTLTPLTQSGVAEEQFPGVGVQTLMPITQAAVGVEHPQGAGVQTLINLRMTGVGNPNYNWVGVQTLQPITQVGAAEEQHPGVGSQILPTLLQSGAGSSVLSNPGVGIQTLIPLLQSGVAEEQHPGVGVQTLMPVLQSGVGLMHPTADGSQILPTLLQSGVAEEQFPGVGSQILPTLTQTAQGLAGAAAGDGVQTLTPLTQSGNGLMHPDGVGSQILASLLQSGAAEEQFPGTGSQILAAIMQAGVGLMHPDGVGSQILAKLTQSGVAEEQFPGVGSQTLTPLTQTGVAEEQHPGVGVQTLASILQNAIGIESFPGVSVQTLPALLQAGVAEEQFAAVASQILTALTQAGVGSAGGPIGDGVQTLPALLQAGAGHMHPDGVGIQTLSAIIQTGIGEIEVIIVETPVDDDVWAPRDYELRRKREKKREEKLDKRGIRRELLRSELQRLYTGIRDEALDGGDITLAHTATNVIRDHIVTDETSLPPPGSINFDEIAAASNKIQQGILNNLRLLEIRIIATRRAEIEEEEQAAIVLLLQDIWPT